MTNTSLNSLLEILRDHDVPYDRGAIKSVFEDRDNQTAIEAWMRESLGQETLLGKDEATLYSTLMKTGNADALAAAHDLSLVRGISDHDIQGAIEELRRSTAAIEKQSESLRQQQTAMSMLVKSNALAAEVRSSADKSQHGKWEAEIAHINTSVEELSQGLMYQTSDLEQQWKDLETGVKQTVDSILRSDDKLLSSLQKLAVELEPGRPEDDAIISRVRDLCASLIKHTVEGIRTRLDRIYLDALTSSTNSPDTDGQEVVELQEELESLYSEILPVAQMSAQQQFLEPALREIAAREGQGQERSVKAIKYINDCLSFLVNRIEAFLERAQESQCHKMALRFVLDETKKELQRAEPSLSNKPISPAKPNAQRRRKSSGSQSPVRVRNTRRRSSGYLDEDIEPEQQLLRSLGISLPAEDTPNQSQMEALERALFDRLGKLESHAKGLQSTTEASISSHVHDAHITLQLLQDSLLAESLHYKVQLLDPGIESSVTALEQDVQDLQKKLEAVNLQKLNGRNVHRDEFTERWS